MPTTTPTLANRDEAPATPGEAVVRGVPPQRPVPATPPRPALDASTPQRTPFEWFVANLGFLGVYLIALAVMILNGVFNP